MCQALFGFELRGLKLEGAWLTFYIKPADGLQLPKIMQWLKQTFSVRFNRLTGRSGHVWGDRYRSAILAEDPPEGAEEVDWESLEIWAQLPPPAAGTYTLTWDSPQRPGLAITTVISVKTAPKPPPPPA